MGKFEGRPFGWSVCEAMPISILDVDAPFTPGEPAKLKLLTDSSAVKSPTFNSEQPMCLQIQENSNSTEFYASSDDVEDVAKRTTPRRRSQVLFRGATDSGAVCFEWVIWSKELQTSNTLKVSSAFVIEVSDRCRQKFNLTMVPWIRGVERDARSFRKSKGCFRLRLKCESAQEFIPDLHVQFMVNGEESLSQVHNFAEKSVCESKHTWNVDSGSCKQPENLSIFVNVAPVREK